MSRGTWWSRLYDRQMDLSFRVGLVLLAGIYAVLGLLFRAESGSQALADAVAAEASPDAP